ncbi:Hypothetical protein PENO1_082830 [Penicillium occitanis (nom. inval.)]|nr:Hypothetical protein PENO1_082830 [Penicillium occitanis (nom. inval.)]PCH04883.1 hypothetical protein PENOC_031100 [Penicillium occitanis (nom. inval.)]
MLVRSVPCYECVRSITNESFSKYPNRSYDVKHETRIGVNSQCSTCVRKHVSPCLPIPPEFVDEANSVYDVTIKDLDVPKDLRTAIRKSIQDQIQTHEAEDEE